MMLETQLFPICFQTVCRLGLEYTGGKLTVAFHKLTSLHYSVRTLLHQVIGTWSDTWKTFSRGEGFFISIPSSAPETTYEVIISGEVPSSNTAETTIQNFVPGLQMLGLAYPVSISLTSEGSLETNPVLGLNAEVGDKIYLWDSETGWTSSTYSSDPFNPGAPSTWTSDLTFQPGKSVFYLSNGSTTWVSEKVDFYAWP